MRKLVNSQEVYIKELEGKNNELEAELRFLNGNLTNELNRDKEKSRQKEHVQAEVKPSCL